MVVAEGPGNEVNKEIINMADQVEGSLKKPRNEPCVNRITSVNAPKTTTAVFAKLNIVQIAV
jgi:hypothetical protein